LLDNRRKDEFFETMLDIPGRLAAGPPIRSILGIAKQAQSLYDVLDRLGYKSSDIEPVGWDWRLGVDADVTMAAVARAVRKFAPSKVVLIVHSTGALVLRAFLAAHPELIPSVEQVLSFGGAWCGTLEALYAVHVGRSQSILGISLIDEDEGAKLIGHTQAAYDLFPPDPARTAMPDVPLVFGADGAPAGANADLGWVKPGRAYSKPLAKAANDRLGARDPDFGDIPLTNVAGWGGPTWPAATLQAKDVIFAPAEKDSGDGTVPYVSTNWIVGANVRTVVIPIGSFVADPIPDLHAHLWDSIAVHQIFKEVLLGVPRAELITAAADSDEAIDYSSGFVTIRMVAQGGDGKPLPNCVATARVNGKKIPVPFNGGRTAVLRLSRQGIHHNAASDIYRFTIDFKWDGGSRKNIAVAFRSP
jgi:pimeloyl-ACP methyl ester carboxylesterase